MACADSEREPAASGARRRGCDGAATLLDGRGRRAAVAGPRLPADALLQSHLPPLPWPRRRQ
eukprot:3782282-Rhodomonas_salina.1